MVQDSPPVQWSLEFLVDDDVDHGRISVDLVLGVEGVAQHHDSRQVRAVLAVEDNTSGDSDCDVADLHSVVEVRQQSLGSVLEVEGVVAHHDVRQEHDAAMMEYNAAENPLQKNGDPQLPDEAAQDSSEWHYVQLGEPFPSIADLVGVAERAVQAHKNHVAAVVEDNAVVQDVQKLVSWREAVEDNNPVHSADGRLVLAAIKKHDAAASPAPMG